MTYTVFLFDFDHTLFDTDRSESEAFVDALAEAGIAEPARHLTTYQQINLAMWADVEAGNTTPDEVRTRRFERLVTTQGWTADPHQMADSFAAGLARRGDLFPGARPVLEALAEQHTLGLVTNALSEVQRGRIERLGIASLFSTIVISSEVGVAKPNPAIFDVAFDQLGLERGSDMLMIGDSLTSDIMGGHNAGLDTCLIDSHRRPFPSGAISPTHRIESLAELMKAPFR